MDGRGMGVNPGKDRCTAPKMMAPMQKGKVRVGMPAGARDRTIAPCSTAHSTAQAPDMRRVLGERTKKYPPT